MSGRGIRLRCHHTEYRLSVSSMVTGASALDKNMMLKWIGRGSASWCIRRTDRYGSVTHSFRRSLIVAACTPVPCLRTSFATTSSLLSKLFGSKPSRSSFCPSSSQ